MKLNTSIVIAAIAAVVAFVLSRPPCWWVPITVLVAGIVDLFTRAWVMSPRLGSAKTLSMALKSICALFGLYAMIGQLMCVGLVIWWFVR